MPFAAANLLVVVGSGGGGGGGGLILHLWRSKAGDKEGGRESESSASWVLAV